MRVKFTLAVICVALAGCAGQPLPEDESRDALTPDAWKNVANDLATPTANWNSFGDPLLAKLIDTALANSPSITIAIETLNQSRIGLDEARANRGNVYSVIGRAGSSKTRDFDSTESYSIAGSASYELDLWGRQRNNVELATLDIISSEAALVTARISLAAEVADTYFQLRVLDERIDFNEQALEYVLKQQSQIQARHDAGIISGVEIDRQEIEVQRLLSQIEDLKGQRSLQEDRLAVLTGGAPQDFRFQELDELVLPSVYLEPNLPAEVLRARPDIRSAEARLQGSILRFENTRKAYFPTINITGSTGLASASLGDLIDDASWSYTIGADIISTLLDNGARRRNVERSRSSAISQVASYRSSILEALRDVERALNQQEVSLRQLEIQKLQLASQERVTRETEARYKLGSRSGFELITQQRQLLSNQEQILNTQLSGIQATIALFRAVGITPD